MTWESKKRWAMAVSSFLICMFCELAAAVSVLRISSTQLYSFDPDETISNIILTTFYAIFLVVFMIVNGLNHLLMTFHICQGVSTE